MVLWLALALRQVLWLWLLVLRLPLLWLLLQRRWWPWPLLLAGSGGEGVWRLGLGHRLALLLPLLLLQAAVERPKEDRGNAAAGDLREGW